MGMLVRELGLQAYLPIWEEMKQFTLARTPSTTDECWLLEHSPVYTQGQAGKAEHVLQTGEIPIVQSDRGGQVTYHGPGQMVAYVLCDLQRNKLGIRALVTLLEQTLILLLKTYDIDSESRCKAPGVYVGEHKIASIGLRVKNGYTYHGIALNVAMDLQPFLGINPCGFAALPMTQIQTFVPNITLDEVMQRFKTLLLQQWPT